MEQTNKSKPPLPLTEKSSLLNDKITEHISNMLNSEYDSLESFKKDYLSLMNLFEAFQKEVISSSPYSVKCKKGCSYCCYHWVEDIYSFEAFLIADYIKKNFSVEEIADIRKKFEDSQKEFLRITDAIENIYTSYESEMENLDKEELILSTFYQLKIPCPLLNSKGECMVYEVRPVTCRAYYNLIDANYCKPENINSEETVTYLCDFEEKPSELLDILHEQFPKLSSSSLRIAVNEALDYELL